MQFFAIVALFTAASVVYGVAQDLLLVQISPEFFVFLWKGEPDPPSPLGMALRQGVTASWWAGILLGFVLATAARIGGRAKFSAKMLVRPAIALLVGMGLFSAIGGIAGYALATSGNVILPEDIKRAYPPTRWSAFQASLLTHFTSYFAAFMGSCMLAVWVWLSRRRIRIR